jgi:DNA-binding MarR family transcriptional regulator
MRIPDPAPDHTGWRLHRAARQWGEAFAARMVARGYPVFAQARAALIPAIGRDGTDQSDLARLGGLTRQAVQQHLDALVADGLVRREADPRDHRRKRVVFTEAGRQMLRVADAVKAEIDAAIDRSLGPQAAATLREQLGRLGDIVK